METDPLSSAESAGQSPTAATSLRARAEAALRQQPPALQTVPPDDAAQLLHDLQVHQIELELQNEELRRTREQVEQSRDHYFDLYDLVPVGHFTLKMHGVIAQANLTAAAMLGVARESLVGQPLSRFIARVDHPAYYSLLARLSQGRPPAACEARLARPDGALLWARLESRRLESSGEAQYQMTATDITAWVQAREALRESEERFRSMAEVAAEAIVAADEQGRILSWNRAAEAIFGYGKDEIVGRSVAELIPARLRPNWQRAMEGYRATGHAPAIGRTGEVTGLRRDGSEFPAELSLAAWQSAQGVLFVAILRDITERRQMERALRERELELLSSELIANVSHELRTPLGLITVACTTLLRQDVTFDAETQREFLNDIREEAEKLGELVDNLLTLSRLHRGQRPLDRQATDLGQLARKIAAAVQSRLTRHCLRCDFPPEPLIAWVDARRIEQVLDNLLANAVKYSPAGGDVVLAGQAQGNEAIVRISDQGISVPPDQLEHIFSRFYRVGDQRVRAVEGVGLGLTVCREIVSAHGGRIWAERAAGGGSVFSFTLPLGAPEEWGSGR